MEQNQKVELKYALEQRRKELISILADTEDVLKDQLTVDDFGDSTLDFNHPADMVSADPDYEKELRLIERERQELAAVNDAIDRLAQDQFGTCDQCGEEIPFQRLKAIPYTNRCIRCQEQVEKAAMH